MGTFSPNIWLDGFRDNKGWMMKLSDYFENHITLVDKSFLTLGYVDTESPYTLAYCDTKYHMAAALSNKNITALITRHDLADQVDENRGIVVSKEPRNLFYTLHNLLLKTSETYGMKVNASGYGSDCSIHPSAVISTNARIGRHVIISENVVIKGGTIIGDHCFIDAGAIIGAEGLLYCYDGSHPMRVAHAGGVIIGKYSSVLAGAVIVKSVHESFPTRIGDYSIIGVQTNIGHEAVIGNNCVFSSNCVVARRVSVGENAFVGPSSSIREHVKIGKNAKVRLGSVVVKDIEENKEVSGNFAIDHQKHLIEFTQRYRRK